MPSIIILSSFDEQQSLSLSFNCLENLQFSELRIVAVWFTEEFAELQFLRAENLFLAGRMVSTLKVEVESIETEEISSFFPSYMSPCKLGPVFWTGRHWTELKGSKMYGVTERKRSPKE